LGNYMGCLMEFYESLTPFYTKMCFKILNFYQRMSVFLSSNLLYFLHTYLVSNINYQSAKGISNTSAEKTKWYFKYQLVLQIPIGTSNTNWYFKYQLVLHMPIGTSYTNWYFIYQLVYQFLFEVMSAT
jgi:hypothetical protein